MKKIIQDQINYWRLEKLKRTLNKVIHYSNLFQKLEDNELQDKTFEFKKRILAGETLEDILPEAYAVCRVAAYRVIGLYPKEVQILGAIAMYSGNIAEMQTGEGKTLTATMPLYLKALKSKGNFLVTTNSYLAKRDYEEMSPLYEYLGLNSTLGFVDIPGYEYRDGEKQEIYKADIIYTTNGILGFDYLIDNLADHQNKKFIDELNYALVDEIDSIILDAAQTPLVISGSPRVQSNLYQNVKEFIDTLTTSHYYHNEDQNEIYLSESGMNKAEHYFKVEDLYAPKHFDLVRVINLSLRAKYLFEFNMDYFVKDGEVILIDRNTGRMLTGTKLQSGLHQALETKESVKITPDLSAMATITFQNLFMQFKAFSGMSATAKLGEREFSDLYSKVVIQIPTDQTVIRTDLDDKVLLDKVSKNTEIIKDVEQIHAEGRPILLITRTAEAAEYYSESLFKKNIPNNLLIAQNVAKEAQIIKEAGQFKAVTVATSMAGRGTDIKLDKKSLELGGLYVVINEHMENSRLDRQLRGRSGRQGDPGTTQIYISLDDYIVKRYSDDALLSRQQNLVDSRDQIEGSKLLSRKIKRLVKKAQLVSEEQAMTAREMSNEYEKSISMQRKYVYQERDRILNSSNFNQFNIDEIAKDVFKRFVYSNVELSSQDVLNYIYKTISFQYNSTISRDVLRNQDNTIQFLMELFHERVHENKKIIKNDLMYQEYIQKSILKAVDTVWIRQVDQLSQLKSSVSNRNGHRNAVSEYHRVALESYAKMRLKVYEQIVKNICLSIIAFDHKKNMIIHFP
ncbi:accessory Sec system translocase SecA2 [Abyssicoccus albus]|uniref:Protein translocase subunit SecA n=1 Tax=Abyssicoccus albus TaxID=1817405 RepID=A0A3N5CAE4_9BACL|nr:accessory Sec system translocase SecA2 [Abyssicoccus albus]RPF56702.1 protein translocase subunit secA [Abyssicoccus albus]